MRGLILALMVTAAATTVEAAETERTPAQRQAVVDLAYVLGEIHALRTVCRGPADQTWRDRMTRLVETEQPDEPFRRRLVDSFNAGFVSRQAQHPTCGPDAADAERETAERGRSLAERLASAGR